MLTYFVANEKNQLAKSPTPVSNALWIDLLKPSTQEREMINTKYQIELPMHHEMHQLEYSNQFYEEKGILYLSANVITKALPTPENHTVTFILTKNAIFTLRYSDPNPIQSFISQMDRRTYTIKNHIDVFFLLLEKIVGTVADIFEIIDEKTDELSLMLTGTMRNSFEKAQGKNLNLLLKDINYLQSLSSKGSQTLSSLELLITYFQQSYQKSSENHFPINEIQVLNQDISALTRHAEHLTHKLGFQLQSTLGLINVQQNQIIKIFTVLAMVFMPPTLIASIYGMNFKHMPELSTLWGYPIILGSMLLSSYLPYRFFKRKGWI